MKVNLNEYYLEQCIVNAGLSAKLDPARVSRAGDIVRSHGWQYDLEGRFVVTSSNTMELYYVGQKCTCKDFERNSGNFYCKHRIAYHLVIATIKLMLEEIGVGYDRWLYLLATQEDPSSLEEIKYMKEKFAENRGVDLNALHPDRSNATEFYG